MKNPIFILAILFYIILIAVIIVGSQELRDMVRLKQSEVEGLKEQNIADEKAYRKTLDSTRKASKVREDSIIFAHSQTLKAHEVSQKEIKKLREIIFIQHTDSSRTAELKNLYPTFKPQ